MHGTDPNGYLSDAFLDRVRRVYERSVKAGYGPADGLWVAILRRQTPVHAALSTDSNVQLREIFADPVASDLFYGVDNLALGVMDPATSEFHGNACTATETAVELLCIALGISRPQLFAYLDAIFGHTVEFPIPFRGEIGISTDRGFASYREIHAVYQAVRTLALLKQSEAKAVIEIGPGMGRTAYHVRRAGAAEYTTVDLPMGIAAQACFLGATLGPEHLWFEGEPAETVAAKIRLRYSLPHERFGVALNVDSITEMPCSTAFSYMRWINRHANVFLSINHDRNEFSVREIGKAALDSAEYVGLPCSIRPDYLEETFVLNGSASPGTRFVWSIRLRGRALVRRTLERAPLYRRAVLRRLRLDGSAPRPVGDS